MPRPKSAWLLDVLKRSSDGQPPKHFGYVGTVVGLQRVLSALDATPDPTQPGVWMLSNGSTIEFVPIDGSLGPSGIRRSAIDA